jgi:uncharacterized protein
MLFVDTNIPMYAGGAASLYRDRCREILRWIAAGRLEAVTDVEVLQEVQYRYYHIRRVDAGRVVFDSLKTVIDRVLPVSADCVFLAQELSRTYEDVKPRDLVHVAVMMENDIRRILSVDGDFDAIAEVDRVDPLTMPEPPALE